MRDIEFRGKTFDKGMFFQTSEWIFGDLEQLGGKAFIDGQHERRRVFPETVGQYAGKTDKNKKRVFEGDIVLIPTDPGIAAVMWNEDTASFVYSECTEGVVVLVPMPFIRPEDVEVIGNIYDNPELISTRKTPDNMCQPENVMLVTTGETQ
jgi:hypothetical protein